MKCKKCKYFEYRNKLDDNLETLPDFEDYGECSHFKHLWQFTPQDRETRIKFVPPVGGLIAANGFYDYIEYTEFYVSKDFGCINFELKEK